MIKEAVHQPDYILMWALIILVFLGLLMLFTSSIVVSKEKTSTQKNPEGSTTYYFFHQILFGLIPGIILAFFFSKVSLDFYRKLSIFAFILAIVALIIIFVPAFGFKAGGAASWIEIGGFTFQPSEFAKLALIIYLAAILGKKATNNEIKSFKEGFIPFLLVLGSISLLLVLQPDFGTLGIFVLISVMMFFMAGGKLSHMFLLGIVLLIVLLIGFQIFPHIAQRVLTFINPQKDTKGVSYQLNQSLIAIGSGGIFGVGIGNGLQKYNYLPEPLADTIFSVWGEEMGFLGCTVIVILYLILAWRGLIISKKAPSKFSQLLGVGITSWILIQAFLNVMAISGIIPFTGIPLPFISYGGTALIMALGAMGILINISTKTI